MAKILHGECVGGGEGGKGGGGLDKRRSPCAGYKVPEVGKHPDLLVGPATATVFPTNDRKFKKSQFFTKIFEKI